MRLLQFSDIHFVDSAKNDNRYAPIEECFFDDIKDQNQEVHIDYVLICGDIAFSGKKEEYDRADFFIQKICKAIGCTTDRVLIVPGNHDLNIEINKTLKGYIRDKIAKKPNDFIKACKGSVELKQILKALYLPFSNYYSFAKKYGCISDFEECVLYQSDFDLNSCYSWEKELTDGKDVVARIVGVNTALLSGCGKKGCKEILPEAMWMNYKKDKSHLNILMGHHPINDISDEKIISGQIDSRFHLQISGHRHIQTTNNKQLSFKITSAAFEPECVSSVKDANQYYPVYNVIDIERNDTGYLIKDKPVVWKWNNPCFIEDNAVEFYAFQSNPTSVQTRTKKQNNSSTVSEEPNQELMKVMLQSMGYDHRRQVISRTFDEPISGATENIDTVVDTAENANLTKVLYAATLIKFGESMYQIYSKNTTPKHPKGKSTK